MRELNILELESVSGGISPAVGLATLGGLVGFYSYARSTDEMTLGGSVGAFAGGAMAVPVAKGAQGLVKVGSWVSRRIGGRAATKAEIDAVGILAGGATAVEGGSVVSNSIEDLIRNRNKQLEDIPY